MELSEFGRIVAGSWEELPSHFPRVSLDAWVVMPDHFHGILLIDTPLPTTCDVPPLTRATRVSPLQRNTFRADQIHFLRLIATIDTSPSAPL